MKPAFASGARFVPRFAPGLAGPRAALLGAITMIAAALSGLAFVGIPLSDPPDTAPAWRERIAADPGDAAAYVGLALAEGVTAEKGSLPAAAMVAATDPNVLQRQAAFDLQRGRLPEAVARLVQLTEYHRHRALGPVRLLARMVADGTGTALLLPQLQFGSQWFGFVLAQMIEQKLPLAPALPLVTEAWRLHKLPPETVGLYIGQLKASRNWVDAFALWAATRGGKVPTLYNRSFEQEPVDPGFDWEVLATGPMSRRGAIAELRSMPGHGGVLEVEFTGRSIANPMVRQHLFIPPGRFRLRGQFLTSHLRTEHGLAWAVRCTDDAAGIAGRSAGLVDSAGGWLPFAFEFTVEPGCGPVVSLQLETLETYEATAGLRGRAAFDDLELTRVAP